MRIGVFTDSWEPAIDGVVTSIRVFRRELEALGHEIHIFAPSYADAAPDGPRTYRYRNVPYPPYPEYKLVVPWGVSFSLRHFKRLGIDIVHSHSPFGVGSMGLYLSWRHGLPSVLTYHTYNEHYLHYVPGPSAMWRSVNRAFTRAVANRYDLTLAPSGPVRDALLSYGVTKPIEVLPSGLDLENLTPSGEDMKAAWGFAADEPMYLSVSRMGDEKNVALIIRAFAQFAARGGVGRLVFLGGGPRLADYQALAASLGMADRVVFKGMRPRAEVVAALSQASLFLFASLSETQGLALLEALALGVPCVIVPAMGTSEVMSGERGGLFCENTPESMADAMARLMADPTLRRAKADEGKARAAEYAAPLMARRMAERFQRLIEERR